MTKQFTKTVKWQGFTFSGHFVEDGADPKAEETELYLQITYKHVTIKSEPFNNAPYNEGPGVACEQLLAQVDKFPKAAQRPFIQFMVSIMVSMIQVVERGPLH